MQSAAPAAPPAERTPEKLSATDVERSDWRSRSHSTLANMGVWLGGAALLVGGIGEALLFWEGKRIFGVALLLAAMLLAVFAWSDRHELPLLLPNSLHGHVARNKVLTLRLVGISGAILLCIGGIIAALIEPDAFFGWQGVLWLASGALLLASCARWYPSAQREASPGLSGRGWRSRALRVLWRYR